MDMDGPDPVREPVAGTVLTIPQAHATQAHSWPPARTAPSGPFPDATATPRPPHD